uniref:Uncharacterized protein n=1 Tax=Cacopsylla melanoneura TaxID=428564 RepID=A0A8D8VK05_9HEMI
MKPMEFTTALRTDWQSFPPTWTKSVRKNQLDLLQPQALPIPQRLQVQPPQDLLAQPPLAPMVETLRVQTQLAQQPQDLRAQPCSSAHLIASGYFVKDTI